MDEKNQEDHNNIIQGGAVPEAEQCNSINVNQNIHQH